MVKHVTTDKRVSKLAGITYPKFLDKSITPRVWRRWCYWNRQSQFQPNHLVEQVKYG